MRTPLLAATAIGLLLDAANAQAPPSSIGYLPDSYSTSAAGAPCKAFGTGSGNCPRGNTVFQNVRLSKTANYTVSNGDKGATFALGGNAAFTLTVNAASGYDSNFQATIVNEDTGRAKMIAISGYTTFRLWPGQAIQVFNQNNTWQIFGRKRWKLPGNTLNLYVDPVNGNDANDCLSTDAGGACATTNHVLNDHIGDEFDANSDDTRPTIIQINLLNDDPNRIHWANHGNIGTNGGHGILIDLGGSLSAVAGGGNVGNGTISVLRETNTAQTGTYTLTATSATNFTVTGPGGALTAATVGTLYANQIGFLITAGGTAFSAGDTFTVTVVKGHALTGDTAGTVQIYFGDVLWIQNGFISNATKDCFDIEGSARLYLGPGLIFNGCAIADINVIGPAMAEADYDYAIDGNFGYHIVTTGGGHFNHITGITVSMDTNITATAMANVSLSASIHMPNTTFQLYGHSFIGQQYIRTNYSSILVEGTTLPGTTPSDPINSFTNTGAQSLVLAQRQDNPGVAGSQGNFEVTGLDSAGALLPTAQFVGSATTVTAGAYVSCIQLDVENNSTVYIAGTLCPTSTTFPAQTVTLGASALSSPMTVSLLAAAGQTRAVQYKTSNNLRWLEGTNSTAESGADVGSDWFLSRRHDDGTAIDNVMSCVRSTGICTFNDGIAFGLITHGVMISEGASPAVASTAMTNGQLLVGQTSADPLPRTVSGDATLSSTGALTITKTSGTVFATSATVNPAVPFSCGPGSITAVIATPTCFYKVPDASTVTNITVSSLTLTGTNVVVALFECGVSTTCTSPTTIGSVSVTAAGTAFPATVSSPAIAAGDYIAVEVTGGTFTAADPSLIAAIRAN